MAAIVKITGIIYKITSKTENKSYIGQAVSHLEKYKNGKMYYSAHGAKGRFSNHVTQANNGFNSPLHQAIRKLGKDDFIITELYECPLENLDEKEQYFIQAYDTKIPHGYNVQSGGECFKHMSVKIRELMKMELISIVLSRINKNGKPCNVKISIINSDKKRFIVYFYVTENRSSDQAIEQARDFITQINSKNIYVTDKTEYSYQDKLDKFKNKIIDTISIKEVLYHNFPSYRVSIKCENKTININFGGKNIKTEQSLTNAQKFINKIILQCQSQQQVTAIKGVSAPL